MTPRKHFRKMPTLNEQEVLDEHLYQMANGIGAGGHQEFRHQQEMLMRNQMMVMDTHSQITGIRQQRTQMQGLAVHFEPWFLDRNILPSSEILSSPESWKMHQGSQLGTSVQTSILPNRTYPGAGYNILPPEAMDSVLRRQELIHKQNLARLEVTALLHQKELENAHRKGLLGMEVPFLYPGIATDAITFHNRYKLLKGQHPSEAFLHQNALGDISVDNGLLMTSNPYPPISTLHRDRNRRGTRRAANQRCAEGNLVGSKGHSEGKQTVCTSRTAEEEKKAGSKFEPKSGVLAKPNQNKMDTSLPLPFALSNSHKECEQILRKHENCFEATNGNISYARTEQDMSNSCATFHAKYMFPTALPLPTLSYGFQVPGSTLMASAGSHARFLPEEDITDEDIWKWTVDDVYNFVSLLPGCSDYAQKFKDHAIDGETLPLLTEGHLLDTMGLKLGPALKIRSQVSRHFGKVLYVMNLPLPAAMQSAFGETVNQTSDVTSPVTSAGGVDLLGSPCRQDKENFKVSEQSTTEKTDKPPDRHCHLQNYYEGIADRIENFDGPDSGQRAVCWQPWFKLTWQGQRLELALNSLHEKLYQDFAIDFWLEYNKRCLHQRTHLPEPPKSFFSERGKSLQVLVELLSWIHHVFNLSFVKSPSIKCLTYRQKFRTLKKWANQTSLESERSKQLAFDQWLRALKVQLSYKNLREVILLEEFNYSLPLSIKTHVEEQRVREPAYRQKFRTLKKWANQTSLESERSKQLAFDQWLRALKVQLSYKNLREVILLEEFNYSLPLSIKTHVEEQRVREPAYRQKFRTLKKWANQTSLESERSKQLAFDQWLRALKVQLSYKNLREVILLEEFNYSLPLSIKTHVEEQRVREPAYRQKFRTLKKWANQTSLESERSKQLAFDQWLRALKVQLSYKNLREVILLEEFNYSLPLSIKTHVEEQRVREPEDEVLFLKLALSFTGTLQQAEDRSVDLYCDSVSQASFEIRRETMEEQDGKQSASVDLKEMHQFYSLIAVASTSPSSFVYDVLMGRSPCLTTETQHKNLFIVQLIIEQKQLGIKGHPDILTLKAQTPPSVNFGILRPEEVETPNLEPH
ncbi:sterile alpha motif domain-containing protein 7 [Heterodontus francisci]|uniref:sterile alpha motif domain-containing protein 7 n=1 Tax=Heterodontus francisci TaxID=7792 RepID=UPI00355B0203